jgi:hypothetical protein
MLVIRDFIQTRLKHFKISQKSLCKIRSEQFLGQKTAFSFFHVEPYDYDKKRLQVCS